MWVAALLPPLFALGASLEMPVGIANVVVALTEIERGAR
jgi:hypothetical protein